MPLFLALCCLFSISQVAKAQEYGFSASTRGAQTDNSLAAIPDSQFAIGDFDGDRQPDVATVEIAGSNPLRWRYSISFQLSKGRLQTIGVTGPLGGVVLLARDVNGDRALDLVLVTAWRHELVAVLLNDGNGNFATADATQFQINAASASTQMGLVSRINGDRTALSFQYSPLHGPARKTPCSRKSEPAFSRALGVGVTSFQSSPSSRAPPNSFLQL